MASTILQIIVKTLQFLPYLLLYIIMSQFEINIPDDTDHMLGWYVFAMRFG